MKKVFIVADYRMLLGDSSVEVFTDINKALQEFNRERKDLKEYAKTYFRRDIRGLPKAY
jgi:hypothetical protein